MNAFLGPIVQGLVRHGLTAAGGYLAAKGHLDPAAAETIVGGLALLLGGGWSALDKRRGG